MAKKKGTTLAKDSSSHIAIDNHGSGHAAKPPVVDASSPNHASRQGQSIQYLVMHNTDGPGPGSLATLRDPATQRSAHYMVDRDGTIYQLVQDSETAWHSGDKLINQQSIGIEIVAWSAVRGMQTEQENAVVVLAQYVVDAYDVKLTNVKSHRAVRPHPTDCPGWIWPTDVDLNQWITARLT